MTAGTYTVTVTDNNGCTTSSSVTLINPTVLTASAYVTSDYNGVSVSCNGRSDGSASVLVNGGVPPYVYSWESALSNAINSPMVSANESNLRAGLYKVDVLDANGCLAVSSVVLTQPPILTAIATGSSNYNGYNISCNGLNNGEIDLTAMGGVKPYQYLWNNGKTSEDLSNLFAAIYTVTVVDVNGCGTTASVKLNQPTDLVTVVQNSSNYNGFGVSCNLSADGSIETKTSGGVSPYQYNWDNGNSTSNISGLSAGVYNLNVIDKNGCTNDLKVDITEPTALNLTYTFVNNDCYGQKNGAIDITLTGGISPYNYNWSNGQFSEDITNISAGTYNLNYSDVNNCMGSVSVTLIDPQVMSQQIMKQDVLCNGGNEGQIIVDVEGGTSPYSYNWSNGSTSSTIDSLKYGFYSLSVSDAKGCELTDTIEILQPELLNLDLNSLVLANGDNISFNQGNDGSIDLTVTGGEKPYQYSWSNFQTTEDINNLIAGTYSVVVTDKNGCTAKASKLLTEPSELAMPSGITPNGDANNDFFVVKGIEAYPDNLLTVYNRWGNIVYEKKSYSNQWNGLNTSGEELPEGTYFVFLEIYSRSLELKGYVEIRRK